MTKKKKKLQNFHPQKNDPQYKAHADLMRVKKNSDRSFLVLALILPITFIAESASYPDVSLSMKIGAQKKAGRGQRARRR